jgi:putative acetyltransferase
MACLGDALIGFGSWDPRGFPTARVGHNCILPAYRGNGYGTAQLKHVTTMLRDAGFERAIARTGAIAFFGPARRMYERCGFATVASHRAGSVAPFAVTEYQLVL